MKLKMPSRTERKFVPCHVNVALVKHLSGDNMRGLSWDLNKCGENVKNPPLSPKISMLCGANVAKKPLEYKKHTLFYLNSSAYTFRSDRDGFVCLGLESAGLLFFVIFS